MTDLIFNLISCIIHLNFFEWKNNESHNRSEKCESITKQSNGVSYFEKETGVFVCCPDDTPIT